MSENTAQTPHFRRALGYNTTDEMTSARFPLNRERRC
jgi:hypothetical protein